MQEINNDLLYSRKNISGNRYPIKHKINVQLVGKTGRGKSTMGNCILGRNEEQFKKTKKNYLPRSKIHFNLRNNAETAFRKIERSIDDSDLKVFHVCPELHEIVSTKNFISSIPLNVSRNITTFLLTGIVQMKETEDKLDFFLEFRSVAAKQSGIALTWSASLYNTEQDLYLDIGKSFFNVEVLENSTSHRLSFLVDDVETFIQDKKLTIAWTVKFTPFSEKNSFADVKDIAEGDNIFDKAEKDMSIKTVFANEIEKRSKQEINKSTLDEIAKTINQCQKQVLLNKANIELLKNDLCSMESRITYLFTEESKTDLNLESKTDLNLENKTDLNLESKTDLNLESKTDLNLESKTDLNLESKTDPSVESKTDLNLENKTDLNLESKTDLNLESKTDLNLESKTDLNLESKTDPSVESKTDQNLESKIDINLESKTDPSVESKTDPSVESKTDQNLESKIDLNLESKTDPSVESKTDLNLERKIINVALLGKTGSGKSASGNSILRKQIFESCGSVTSNMQHADTDLYCPLFRVYDGPDFVDTSDLMDNKQVVERTLDNSQDEIVVFLLVFNCGAIFSEEDKKIFEMLKSIFSQQNVKDFSILMITHGDLYISDKINREKAFETWCSEQTGVLKELMEECGNRVVLFDNNTEDPEVREKQMTKLINIIDRLPYSGRRYFDKHFKSAEDRRKSLLVESKERRITENIRIECCLLLNKARRSSQHEPAVQLSELKNLLAKAEHLKVEVLRSDQGTGVLTTSINLSSQLCDTIESEINILTTQKEKNDIVKEILEITHNIEEKIKLSEEEYKNQAFQVPTFRQFKMKR